MQPLEISGTYDDFFVVQLVFLRTPLPRWHSLWPLHFPTRIWCKHYRTLEAIRNTEKCCQRENQVPARIQFLSGIMLFLILFYNLLNLLISVYFFLLYIRAFLRVWFGRSSFFSNFSAISTIYGGSARRKTSQLLVCACILSSRPPPSSQTKN